MSDQGTSLCDANSLLGQLLRANNRVWSSLYYDELVETNDYQLTFMAGADAGFYSCAQVVSRDDDDLLSLVAHHYRRRGVAPAFYVDPGSPPGLVTRLERAGYLPEDEERENCHLLDLRVPPVASPSEVLRLAPSRLQCIRLEGPTDPWLEAFLAVDSTANHLSAVVQSKLSAHLRRDPRPGVERHCFLGLVDGIPVSTRLVSFEGDFALLAEGGTLPAFRRHGVYASLLLEALSFAQSSGKRYAFFTAAVPAFSNPAARKLGFTLAATRTYYRLR